MHTRNECTDGALLSFSQHPGARRQTSVEYKVVETRSETQRGLGKGVGRRAAVQEQNCLPVQNSSL